jgi:hypothetical protein
LQDEPTTIRPAAVPWFNNLASLISWSKTAIVDVERVHVSSTRYMRLIPRGPGMGRSGSGYSWDNGLASLPMGDSHGLWRRWCTYIVPASRQYHATFLPTSRRHHAGITPVSRRYHAGITPVSRWHHADTSLASRRHLAGITPVSRRHHAGITRHSSGIALVWALRVLMFP